jgi:pullulanase-type alpha-1,6-glucosidase
MTIRCVSSFSKKLCNAAALLLVYAPLIAVDAHGQEPSSVTVVGSLQSELGCPGDWQPDCGTTHLAQDAEDTVWQGTFVVPAGSYEYKAALNDSWDENYGANAQLNGANISLDLGVLTDIKFYYSHETHWITDNVNARIVTAAGSFQDELGCSGDWQPWCLRSWLQDPDGDGIYTFETDAIPAGDYEAKAVINEDWSESYPAANLPFSVGEDGTVLFSFNAATNTFTVTQLGPSGPAAYAIIHYFRGDGDYGDHTTGDYNDYWGLHPWGDALHPAEVIEWTNPKPFLGETEYGRFTWVKLAPGGGTLSFIVHRGDTKDGTDADRFFDVNGSPEIWLKSDDATVYTSQAEAQGFATIRYQRPDGDYGDPTSPNFNDFWGLHLWGDAIVPSEGTDWNSPKPFTGVDDYGAYWNIALQDATQPLNFIIHRGDTKDPGPDQSAIPAEVPTAWIQSGDEEIYSQRGAAEGFATLRYHRPDGDYGDPTSPDFNDFWGMHVWAGAASPNPGWTDPLRPSGFDTFGPYFTVDLIEGAPELAYILHRGDTKDPGPDQFLNLSVDGYEIWQLQGADFEAPYVYPLRGGFAGNAGNIREQHAYFVDRNTIAWSVAEDTGLTFTLHAAADGGLNATNEGIADATSVFELSPGVLSDEVKAKFPHLSELPALTLPPEAEAVVRDLLRSQIAVSAVNAHGKSVDATGLQIPGVLDDLFTYDGQLGVVFDGGAPTFKLWAPTARSVTFHLFADSDPITGSTTAPMTLDPMTGVWQIFGTPDWTNLFYLFEVEVFVNSTGNVENNIVTDPYSVSLAMNSTRSQIVDLGAASLKPAGWDSLLKPPLAAPEDISIYELHVRDFSANDASVPDEMKGTFKAFALDGSNGNLHLGALAASGLTHVHLLPVFDIATINEDKSAWQSPDPSILATYPPDSDLQQAAVTATEDLDGFNWGYDPFHYTTPEGSYSTNPDGAARVVEFREMVKGLSGMGLRVVMDVVYNHTNSAGQNDKSVLDKIVPGYYHRLNDRGAVETSTCCPNTATEHNMMEKLMVDSLVTWAREYKVDAFRFDLMGHHSKANLSNIRAALDALTVAQDGIDGSAIYLYGEGWNFGEVANNARFVQATQANMAGTGVGSFNDRIRDAVRGGGPFSGLQEQGFATGLCYDPNATPQGDACAELLRRTDWVRVALAGNLANYVLEDRNGNTVPGSAIDYQGQPAGYTLDPQEIINYASAHDNETLFDAVQFKLPIGASMAERVRAHNMGLSVITLGQGVPFFHAGTDMLRSKSLDRDSYNSGDWFNRLDFTYQDNNWGVGLPVASKNEANWPIMQPLLADPALDPAPAHIGAAVDHYQEMLQIRRSSALFRLPTEAEVSERLAFHNTGPGQVPGLIVMSLYDGYGDVDLATEQIISLFNATDDPVVFPFASSGRAFELHPVQAASADPVVQTAYFDITGEAFHVPARTTAVFLMQRDLGAQIDVLIDEVDALEGDQSINAGQANALRSKLLAAQKSAGNGKLTPAANQINAFINLVESLMSDGILSAEEGAVLTAIAEEILQLLG